MARRIILLIVPLVLSAIVVPATYAQPPALTLTGDTQLQGNLSIVGQGKGISFPDGTIQSTAGQSRYVRTVGVSPAASEAESGAALRAALASITDANETRRYLIKIEPGVYNLGSTPLQMLENIDIEGSGILATVLTGSVDNFSGGVVKGASNAEIRHLTVRNTSTGADAAAIYNENAFPRIVFLKAVSDGGGSIVLSSMEGEDPAAISAKGGGEGPLSSRYGIRNVNASPFINHVYAEALSGTYNYGIYNDASSPQIFNSWATAFGGSQWAIGIISSNGSSPSCTNVIANGRFSSGMNAGIWATSSAISLVNVIASGTGPNGTRMGLRTGGGAANIWADRCTFQGVTYSIWNAASFNLYMGATKLEGPIAGAGLWKCAGCYDADYNGLKSDCKP